MAYYIKLDQELYRPNLKQLERFFHKSQVFSQAHPTIKINNTVLL